MSKKSHYVLIFFAVLVPILILILTLILSFFRNDVVSIEADLLAAGIAIISVAVSVWIGLNIYNFITKNDIQEEIQKIYNKEMGENLSKQIFLNELEKTADIYGLSEYLYEKFQSISLTDSFIGISYDELRIIENEYARCCIAYENNQWNYSQTLAESLLKRLEIKMIDTRKYQKDNMLLGLYLKSRLGDMYFYKNVCGFRSAKTPKNNDEMAELVTFFNDILLALRNDAADKKYEAYVNNTIGYTLHLLSLVNNKNSDSAHCAQDYLIKAVTLAPENGRYHRNLGLTYEKSYMVSGNIQDYDCAMEQYELARKQNPTDFKSYNNLAALHLKRLDRETKFSDRKKLISEMSFSGTEVLAQLNQDISYLQLGMQICVTFEDLHYNLGKALMYKYLFEGKHDSTLISDAINVTEMVKLINQNNTGYRFVLRNIMEAVGNISEAQRYNNELISMKCNGDCAKVAKLYEHK